MASQKISFFSLHFLILLIFISFGTHFSFAANSISLNQSLSGDQTITSNGDKFELGFFNQGNPLQSYIGIWCKNDSRKTPVWVANRETPVTDTTNSELKFSDDGNLVLINESATQIWSTNLNPIASNSTVAVILDSGNLVLRDGSDPTKVLWQSCDHPTDTWLLGCYLGLNKVTGENLRLTSWKNKYDPAPGLFSLEVESAQFFLLWNNSKRYWASGNWNGQGFSDASPLFMSLHIMYESNATVNYFTYFVDSYYSIERITLDHSGLLVGWYWGDRTQQLGGDLDIAPETECDVYAGCGNFGICMVSDPSLCYCPRGFSVASSRNWDLGYPGGGCVRDNQLQCSANDWFSPVPDMSVNESPDFLSHGSSGDCELACLKNCSCVAYSYGSMCSLWYGDFLTMRQFSDGYKRNTLHLRMGPNSKNKNKEFIWEVLGATVGFISFLVVIIVLFWRCQKQNMIRKIYVGDVVLVPFRYRDMQKITRNFSERLGGGGFGSVFKGMLPDSTIVAVKKLEGILQGEKQFRSEVRTLGVIQHVNLVRLLGFCSEGLNKLLVYEYMPNGSLDFHLFRNSSVVLDWTTRYEIAIGTARGLYYLHEKCRDCIIHCDIKPENILLDGSFVAKVADFGLAKSVDRNFSNVLTTMRGTIGYLAPEWISGGSITAKADVYSYGMMLLEIISGRRNTEQLDRTPYFPVLAANKVLEGDVLSLLDPRLEGNANLEELDRACKVACWCIQENEACRPSMGQVVQILEGTVEVNMPPMPRLLQALSENILSIIYFSDEKTEIENKEAM